MGVAGQLDSGLPTQVVTCVLSRQQSCHALRPSVCTVCSDHDETAHLLAGDAGPQCYWHSQGVGDADCGAGPVAHRALQAQAAHGRRRSADELDLVVRVLPTALVLEGDARMHQALWSPSIHTFFRHCSDQRLYVHDCAA